VGVKIFYFGAWGGPGHYIWAPFGETARKAGPWTDRDLDALTCPLTFARAPKRG
jgi:hypothetical protein